MRRWLVLFVSAPIALSLEAVACSTFDEAEPAADGGSDSSLASEGGPDADAGPTVPFSERWATARGGGGDQVIAALGIDETTNIVIVGNAAGGVMDFGCDAGAPPAEAGTDGFITRFRGDGTCDWARRITGPGDQTMIATAVRGDGRGFAAGLTTGDGNELMIGGKRIDHRSKYGSFAVSYAADGSLIDTETIFTQGPNDSSNQIALSIAALDDRFVWAGNATAGFNSDGQNGLQNTGSGADAWVGRKSTWLRSYGKAGIQTPHALAVGKNNEIYLAGDFNGQVATADGGALSATAGSYDAFLGKIDSAGDGLWQTAFGNATGQRIQSLFVDKADDTVLFAGDTVGTITIGKVVLSVVDNAVFFGKVKSNGELVWAKSVTVSAAAKNARITARNGRVLLGATVSGKADCGGGPLAQGGDEDFFLCVFDESDGKFLAGRGFGAAGNQSLAGLAWTPDGDIVIGGSLQAPFTIGSTTLTSSGDYDIFLARLAPP